MANTARRHRRRSTTSQEVKKNVPKAIANSASLTTLAHHTDAGQPVGGANSGAEGSGSRKSTPSQAQVRPSRLGAAQMRRKDSRGAIKGPGPGSRIGGTRP